jgi:hypothetical protein
MKSAIILHGMPSKEEYFDTDTPSPSNNHWLPWVQHELLVRDVLVQTPELPLPYLPVYEEWCKVFEQFTLDKDTMLIGHSCGTSFLLRWLSEHKIKVGKVALIAPWLDPENELQNNFFAFDIDEGLLSRVEDFKIFISHDDYQMILDSVKVITEKLPQAKVEWFEGKGHFVLSSMKTEKFPELLDFLSK